MFNRHCQKFKRRIEELKGKTQSLEGLLLEYRNTGDEEIAKQFEKGLERIIQEIEEFKEEFKNKSTKLIEKFIQRRENKDVNVEIIFDEEDFRFIINGPLVFHYRTQLNDFPTLIKEVNGALVVNYVQILNLRHLKKALEIHASDAQTIDLSNLEEAKYIYAHRAQILDLTKLKKVLEIYTPYTKIVDLHNLEEAEKIVADNAQYIDLSKLRKVKNVYAPNAETIDLFNLEEAEYLYVYNVQTLYAPRARKLYNLYVYNAQTINLPNIREIDNVYFNENNPNLESLLNQAREWKEKGILKGKIVIMDSLGRCLKEL